MSKSKMRKKFAALSLGLLGAQKLGLLGGAMGDNKMAKARKLMTSDKAMKGVKSKAKVLAKTAPAVKIPGKVVNKTPLKSGPFKMFGASKMPSSDNLRKFREANERMRMRKFGTSRSNMYASSGLSDMGGAKKGKMIKARGGGMAKTKPTKMY